MKRNGLEIKAQKLRAKKLTYQQIADRLGYSNATIQKWVKQSQSTPPQPGKGEK